MRKKLLTIILSFTMLFGMSMTSYADEADNVSENIEQTVESSAEQGQTNVSSEIKENDSENSESGGSETEETESSETDGQETVETSSNTDGTADDGSGDKMPEDGAADTAGENTEAGQESGDTQESSGDKTETEQKSEDTVETVSEKQADPYIVNVTYKLNGGKNNANNLNTYDTASKSVTLGSPQRTGYTFLGWYKDSKFTKKITSIAKHSSGNMTIYAKWKTNTYNIRFNGNGATKGTMTALSNCKCWKYYTLTANKFTRTNYVFKGWNSRKDGKGTSFTNKAKVRNVSVRNGATVTLYAQWTKLKAGPNCINGKYYLYNTKLQKITKAGAYTVNGKKYYVGTGGILKSGWITIKGYKYYFNSKTFAATTGKKQIGKVLYYFNKYGALINSNTWFPKSICHALGGIDGHIYTNSKEAFINSYNQGFRDFEVDLVFTQEEDLVCRHGWSTDIGTSYALGTRATTEEFKNSKIYGQYTPLTFEDLCYLMLEYPDARIVTDTKYTSKANIIKEFTYMMNTLNSIGHPELIDRFIVCIYHERMYYYVKDVFPVPNSHIVYTTYKVWNGNETQFQSILKWCKSKNIGTVAMWDYQAKDKIISMANSYGINIYTFTVDSLSTALKDRSRGIQGFISDTIRPSQL